MAQSWAISYNPQAIHLQVTRDVSPLVQPKDHISTPESASIRLLDRGELMYGDIPISQVKYNKQYSTNR